ncbi:MAG TPA: hypothetical protein VHB98_01910 [Chloroflexota bacterium]|nr:hypothetical protein [Chloroflexota bacterium]
MTGLEAPVGDVCVLREGSASWGAGALMGAPAKMRDAETAPRKGLPSCAGISSGVTGSRGGEPFSAGQR